MGCHCYRYHREDVSLDGKSTVVAEEDGMGMLLDNLR
jgi:hypothetical protein